MQARYIKEIEEYRVLSKENFEYYPHFHVQMEILFLERGREEVVIDGRLFQMEGGDVCISFPNQVHDYRLVEENMAYLLILPIEDVEEYRRELTECIPVNPVIKKDRLPEYFSALWLDFFIIIQRAQISGRARLLEGCCFQFCFPDWKYRQEEIRRICRKSSWYWIILRSTIQKIFRWKKWQK